MIISHKHKFIFIKTRKTAGTSIEVWLSQCCGPEDIVTPFGIPEENHQARNWGDYYNHISASEIKSKIGIDCWQNYYKFCFERNPWDKVVSYYHFNKLRRNSVTIQQLVDENDLPVDSNRYCADGGIAVDKICRYETLQTDLMEIARLLGLHQPVQLPHAKGQFRPVNQPYQSYFSDLALRQSIADQFSWEIENLGYRY